MYTPLEFFASIGDVNRYALLSRMVADCRYYLGYGNRSPKCLWAGEPAAQLVYMGYLLHSFQPDAMPEWFTPSDLAALKRQMLTV